MKNANLLFSGTVLMGALLLATSSVHASGLGLSLIVGFPLARIDLNTNENKDLGAKTALGLEVVKPLLSAPVAFGVFYQGYFMSDDYGQLPFNTNGLLVYYYPFGMPSVTKVIDGNVGFTQTRPSLYVKTGMGLSFFNVRGAGSARFGASAIAYQIASGYDFPVDRQFVVGVEANYLTTFGGQSTDEKPVGVTGFTFNLRMTHYMD